MAGQGFDRIPLRIPREYDPDWFERFVYEVLALGDIRNAIEGQGISISGNSNEPATISASEDVAALLGASLATVQVEPLLINSRTLTPGLGIRILDGGAGGPVTFSIDGIPIGALEEIPAFAVLGSSHDDGDGFYPVEAITSATNNTVLKRYNDGISDLVGFAQVEYADIADASALSVLGRSANSSGVLADILAGTDKTVLGQDSDALAFQALDFSWLPTRTLTAGAGLTGGGDLSADRTFDVGAGTGITVNADDVALSAEVLGATFLTQNDETGVFANSRQLLSGTNITLDDATPGELTINASGGGGATDFIDLGDVPNAYTGAAGFFVRVNAAPDGLEFVERVPDAALSANVALLDRDPQTFSGQTIATQVYTGDNDEALVLASSLPALRFTDTDAGSNEKNWLFGATGTLFFMQARDDAGVNPVNWLLATRSGTAILSIALAGSLAWGGGAAIASSDDVVDTESGSFTATLTGMTAATTGTIQWHRTGRKITLHAPLAITGTSNLTSMNLTGVPAAIQPSTTTVVASLIDNGAQRAAEAFISGGTIQFRLLVFIGGSSLNFIAGGFAAVGTKGLHAGWSVTYDLG